MIDALQAVLFGIVEGITEWLPISSTGHMMLVNQFLPLNVSDEFYDTFLVVIQLGAICAVLLEYFSKLNPFSRRKTAQQKKSTWSLWLKIVVGTIPAAVVGLLLDDFMEEHVTNNPNVAYIVVSAALIVYGVIFILLERVPALRRLTRTDGAASARRGKHERVQDDAGTLAPIDSFEDLSLKKAIAIGCFLSLAVIPGTSRSGSTIIGARLLGTSRSLATEFAFYLAIPIMLGWSGLKFIKHGFAYTSTEWMILAIGCVSAFLVSIVVIKFLVGYVRKHDFTVFGVYRIILAVVVLVYFGLIAA